MEDKIGSPSSDGGNHFQSIIDRARKEGAVRIDGVDGDVYIVVTRARGANASALFKDSEGLLKPPTKRAAYSDRTAWLMAALSELAYQRFEDDAEICLGLEATLADANLLLVDTFNSVETGTQAILACRENEFAVLAFRGTEKDKRDIVTDLSARFYRTPHGRSHEGFARAYESVRSEILDALTKLPESMPLFITGHSLGGALATAATQDIEAKHLISACYTFGSPRVGCAEWCDTVKAPIYRIVNGADAVPLVPGGVVMRWLLTTLPNLPFLTWLEKPVEKFISSGYVGFQHAGDLRFLHGSTNDAILKIGSAASWARFRHIVVGKIGAAIKAVNPRLLTATFADHSISQYRIKLQLIATNRN